MKKKMELLLVVFAMALILSFGFDAKAEEIASTCGTGSITLNFGNSDYKEVQLLTRGGALKESTKCYSSAYFYGIKSNTLYYCRYRYIDYYGDAITEWSSKKPCALFNVSVKLSRGKVRFKVPKVKGIKKFKIYMTTTSGSGYRKIKTLKPGKSFRVSKFKGKKFKYYKNYYYRVDAITNSGKKSVTSFSKGFYLYRY